MKILTIDLGTTVGYAVLSNGIKSSGFQKFERKKGRKTKADDHKGKVFRDFFVWSRESISLYKPDLIAYEEPMGSFQNASACHMIVGLRGVLMAVTAQYGIEVISIPQTKLKLFAVNYGAADKDAMLLGAQMHLDKSIKDHNEADARWILEWAISQRLPVHESK